MGNEVVVVAMEAEPPPPEMEHRRGSRCYCSSSLHAHTPLFIVFDVTSQPNTIKRGGEKKEFPRAQVFIRRPVCFVPKTWAYIQY